MLRPTTHPLTRRLRWLMLCVILVDSTNTLLGQTSKFWEDPTTAIERNQFVRLFLTRGWESFAAGTVLYLVVTFLAATFLPKRLGLILVFSVILGHFFGASTWWVYRWDYGMKAPIAYGIVVAVALVLCGVGGTDPDPPNASAPAPAKD